MVLALDQKYYLYARDQVLWITGLVLKTLFLGSFGFIDSFLERCFFPPEIYTGPLESLLLYSSLWDLPTHLFPIPDRDFSIFLRKGPVGLRLRGLSLMPLLVESTFRRTFPPRVVHFFLSSYSDIPISYLISEISCGWRPQETLTTLPGARRYCPVGTSCNWYFSPNREVVRLDECSNEQYLTILREERNTLFLFIPPHDSSSLRFFPYY